MKNPLYNRIAFVLSFVGLMVAGYLWFLHATHGDVPCGGSGGCDRVAKSPYARFPAGNGFYVAAYGTLGYLALTVLTFLRTLGANPKQDRLFLSLIVLSAGAGTLFSLHLTYIELYVIRAICKWCIASQALIAGVLVVSVTEVLQQYLKQRGRTSTE